MELWECPFSLCMCQGEQYSSIGAIIALDPTWERTIADKGCHIQDGTSKMSKSAENDNSRINMTDPAKLITRKFKSAKTDDHIGLEWDNPDRPECQNLLTIYAIVTGKGKDAIASEVKHMSWGTFKPILAEAVVEHLRPYQAVYDEVMADPGQLDRVLKVGADAANEVASATLERVRDAMGFLPPLLD
jgi:tryptophanyl-tRNA synthetase